MPKPRHIVIDAREIRTTTGRYIERLLHYLQIVDTKNKYTVLLKPKDMGTWFPDNPNFTKLASPYKEFTFAEQLGLLKQIKSLKADLVHFPMVQQPILYKGTVVTTMNDLTTIRFKNPSKNHLVFTLKQIVYGYVNQRVAKKSQQLITYTNFVKQDIITYTGVNSDKITPISLAADPIADDPEPIAELAAGKYIMYIGRPLPHKNLGRLIDAFAILKDKHPDLKLVLAGKKDALYEAHERRANEAGITGIVFTGFVSEGQLRWLYENCGVYVFPSLSEGFGLPGLEAMEHGAPVASSNATCLPEVYGDAVYYFDPVDVDDMAAKINDILTDVQLRDNLIATGHTQASAYSWKRMAGQTLEIYKKALKS
ncbi:MAG: glycosyltransferase family 1 protein [Candidatus Saccharimonadales bacterium]